MSPIKLAAAAALAIAACGPYAPAEVPPPPALQPIGDAQAIEVMRAIDDAEVSMSDEVAGRLIDAVSRSYALDMAREHAQLQVQLGQVVESEPLVPAGDGVSSAIVAQATLDLADLRVVEGRALDFSYLYTQVQMHRSALALVDCGMSGHLNNAALEAFVLGTFRPALADHFARAVAITDVYAASASTPNYVEATRIASCADACDPFSPRTLPALVRRAACR